MIFSGISKHAVLSHVVVTFEVIVHILSRVVELRITYLPWLEIKLDYLPWLFVHFDTFINSSNAMICHQLNTLIYLSTNHFTKSMYNFNYDTNWKFVECIITGVGSIALKTMKWDQINGLSCFSKNTYLYCNVIFINFSINCLKRVLAVWTLCVQSINHFSRFHISRPSSCISWLYVMHPSYHLLSLSGSVESLYILSLQGIKPPCCDSVRE